MRKWQGFKADTEEAILPMDDIMSIVSTPRHTARLSGKYVSSASTFAPEFLDKLRQVTRGARFWDPNNR